MWASVIMVYTCCFYLPNMPPLLLVTKHLFLLVPPIFYSLVEQSVKVPAYSQLLPHKFQLMNMPQA